MYISITGLKTKNFLSEKSFGYSQYQPLERLKKAEGNLFCETKRVNGYQHTITAWKDRNMMIQYLTSKVHAKAMKNFNINCNWINLWI
ncbi:hypothetical protein ABXT43_07320 [Candidatus Pelagibacter sp. Uisw_114]